MNHKTFTSESVSEGHPDKIADQISDAILDAILMQDKNSRVACETLVSTGMVILAGEINTNAWVDIEDLARRTIKNIGYTSPLLGFDAESCAVITAIGKQSPDIALGLECTSYKEQGAGDQGMMFGYASNETDVLMPAPIMYAHLLMRRHAEVRKKNILPWLRPDAKSQVTISYFNGKPHHVDAVVLSTQHEPDIKQDTIKEAVYFEIIKPTFPHGWLSEKTKIHINPTGRFVIGGPVADCGLTGRKIIVDSYGGMARHGGGCFSGKDPSKVDRTAAYAARYVAKNVVAAGLAERCEIQLSYAIGIAQPISVQIDTFGTNIISESILLDLIKNHFDLRPAAIINYLDLLRPIYLRTATYGHFGRKDIIFPWEKTDKAELLNKEAGLNTEIYESLEVSF